ncbi:DUF2723 domain-containing protein [Adhaeribacter sp. BT258]|uniref:DUF2723 domain-containing protein n=1 Tax=Adhaeribacter terrigena TaxID=2793070 RepID=A0ABS1C608_9BACT|nr:DUF2723 domain-containing protein [Adhaeribacter terrigena]MBK0404809.1 DUF2723 domain-containing protein [Adhaeribacter terrigena]
MRTYKRINDLAGWIIFLVATFVYVKTLEPTASFWDCGEFIACSYKLLVPHPPGAPFFLMIGRLFSMFATDPTNVAFMVNLLSALSSSFTVLFLYWSITILGRKMLICDRITEPTTGQTWLLIGSGAVGALAFTFTDSFWFSAVEAEVYAMSSFFTAIVFWAMLKWEARSEEPTADKWLILIAYLTGLSIGVHLLNLLAIPSLAFIYYYRKHKANRKGALATFVISAVIIVFILWGIIPGLPSLAGSFEVFFINNMGLPFGAGIIIFLLFFLAALYFAFAYSYRKNLRWLNTALLCFVFILIGYSSYLMIPIRSAYNPTIDENDPENIVSFVSYLKREQYGDRPLLYGPQFNAEIIDEEKTDPRYFKGKDKYEIVDYKTEPVYNPKDMALLPRIYSNQPAHIQEYKKWVNIQEGKKPTMGQNLSFLMRYQLGHMYWRYFLWNFVGREGDVQQSGVLWPAEGDKNLPERVGESMARNNFYALPLILGIIGLIFQIRRNGFDAFIVGLLFFFTGIAIALYLNQPPIEPRERDYTFAGSFFAFSIWIGLGVMGIAAALKKMMQSETARAAVATVLGLSVPAILAAEGWDDHDRSHRYHSVDSAINLLQSCAPNAILFTNGDNDTFPLWYAQEVEGIRTDVRVAVLSYLNTDWYVDQMKRQSYKSDPLPISLENPNYRQGTNDYLPFVEKEVVKNGMDLKQFVKLVKDNYEGLQVQSAAGRSFTSFPTKTFFLNVDRNAVIQNNAVPANRQAEIVPQLNFNVGRSALEKKHLVILDILATNNWKRPVYFSTTVNTSDFLNLDPYLQLEGLAYRIVPVRNQQQGDLGYVEKDLMYNNIMNKFQWREMDNPNVFYDENYLRFPSNARNMFGRLATEYLKAGDKAKAKEVLDHCFKVLPDKSIPYDYYTPPLLLPLAEVGQRDKAAQIVDVMGKRTQRALDYYFTQGTRFDNEIQLNLFTLQQLVMAAQQLGMQQKAAELNTMFQRYYGNMQGM